MHPQSNNLFLTSLSLADRSLLVDRCTEVALPLHASLYEAESSPRYAYFMTAGLASIVLSSAEGQTMEVSIIGMEGVVGSTHLLGTGLDPSRCFVQIEGRALRIPFRELQHIFRSSEGIRERLLEFVQQQAQTLSQLASCHRAHDAEARLAHWLLMLQDRTRTETLALTQEALGMILGSGRPTVTMAAVNLQRQGLIEYRRGQVKILDRASLKKAACSCYLVTQKLHASLYTRDLPLSRQAWMHPQQTSPMARAN